MGDALLFVAAPGGTLDTANGPAELHYITAVSTDPVANVTQVAWDTPVESDFSGGANVYVFRAKAALFGANAGEVSSTLSYSEAPPYDETTTTQVGKPTYDSWDDPLAVVLDSSYPGVVPGTGSAPTWLALTLTERVEVLLRKASGPGESRGGVAGHKETVTCAALFTVSSVRDENPQMYNLTSRATALTVGGTALPLANFRENPDISGSSTTSATTLLSTYIGLTPLVTAYAQSEQLTGAPLPLASWIVWGQYLNVVGGQQIPPGQVAAVSGKRVRLQIPLGANSTFTAADAPAGSTMDGQVVLLDSSQPSYDPAGNALWSVITTSGVAGTLLLPSQPGGPSVAASPAAQGDPVASEAITIQTATPSAGGTTLQLAAPLSRIYDASTVSVNANAVLATHGQTVQEILGSGDATNAALTFTLKQPPLTYLPTPAASGVQSTLQVWVNNLRWQEVPNLLSSGAADRVYTTSVDTTSATVVRFGDGTRGGRPPTGQANIRAVYRTGTGVAGMVAAGQLSQPLDRPQGLSSVTNPSAASGGQDPAAADEVQASAPLLTLTIGRVVSLEDYQDYALGFAGIAKALATYAWSGDTRSVFLTVAGATGAVLGARRPGPVLPRHRPAPVRGPVHLADDRPARPRAVHLHRQPRDRHHHLQRAGRAAPGVAGGGGGVRVRRAGSRPGGRGQRGHRDPAGRARRARRTAARTAAQRRFRAPRTGAPGGRPRPPSGTQPALGAELLLLDPATQGQLAVWS